MSKKIKGWIIVTLPIVVFSSSTVIAEEVQTNGTIGFTGVYEPIGTPDPKPPESIVRPPITEVTKPGGTLPQTNDNGSSRLLWLGILIISFVFFFFGNEKKNTKLKQ